MTALVCAVIGGFCFAVWFSYSSGRGVDLRVDRSPPEAAGAAQAAEEIVDIEGQFETFDGTPSKLRGAWPCFRGANHDNLCADRGPLADRWEAGGPPVLWSVHLGEGYAGPAVMNGCVYVLDYDEKNEGDALRCFSLDDGREIWRRWYKVRVKRNHGMSRTVPAVTEDFAVTIGPRCQVLCVEAKTGAFKWGIDLVREFGTQEPMWYTGQCPLIDGETAVIAPAGPNVLLMGVDCRTGRIEWKTPNPRGWQMSHASVVPMSFAGRRMYAYAAVGGMAGMAADGEDRGKVLWETTEWNLSVVAPSPVPLPEGRIFVTAGYGAGSRMFQLVESGGAFSVKSLYELDRKVFACEQHTPVFYGGRLFSILPIDAGPVKQQFVCMNLDGGVEWRSSESHRFGLGPYLVADGKFFILSDDGDLTMIKASTEGFEPLAEAKVLDGKEAWAPMAIADGRLLVRDSERMVCLDVGRR